MFANDELTNLHKCVDYSINHLESYLSKYNDYLSNLEKMEMIEQLTKYKDISLKIENIINE